MGTTILILLLILAACFGLVLLRGAPYLPTLTKQVATAMELIDLKRGDTLLELGCGDGKVLVAAAERGLKVMGYELNPILAFICWLRTRKYRGQVEVVWGDFWTKEWPEAQGIFTFLLDPYMQKLDTNIAQQYGQYGKYKGKSVKVVSFAFQIPGRVPRAQKDGLFLYEYK